MLIQLDKQCNCCGNNYKTSSSEGYYCTKCGQALSITLCADCQKKTKYYCPTCGASKEFIAEDFRGCLLMPGTYKGNGWPMEVTTEKNKDIMNGNVVNRLAQTFGKDKDKYYVYMLMVEGEGKPFYIGKGAGARVFAHELDADAMLKAINQDRQDKEANYNKLSDKIKTIINNKRKVKKVIVKWGLTEDEAFMCESALINMYDYLCNNASDKPLSKDDALTNIVNGHASKKEIKSNSLDGSKTKARDIEDFLKNVAISETKFPRDVENRCVFININEAMDLWYNKYSKEPINKDEYIMDSVRCFWRLRNFGENDASNDKYNGPKYVIAMYQQVVVGVYKVVNWFRFTEIDQEEEIPIFPQDFRDNDRKLWRSYNNTHKITDNRLNRIGFTLEKSNNGRLNDLIGKLLADPFLKTQGGKYNFNEKGDIVYRKWDDAANKAAKKKSIMIE